jgi:tRNA A37 methylthiotransferase MiaB
MVEGRNDAKQQWIARTSQNKVLNFSAPDGVTLALGTYVNVVITGCFPNSLAGVLVV